MRTVRIGVEIPEERYRAYKSQAECNGTTVEELVEQVVRGLLDELDREERKGDDHLIFPC
jgi:hypothetical protein